MKFQIILIIAEAVLLSSFLIFVRLSSKMKFVNAENLQMVADWAYRLAVNAKNILDGATGEEKKENVMSELREIAKGSNLQLSDFQLSAFIEEAYDKIKGRDNDD